jgi:hypothetical protein
MPKLRVRYFEDLRDLDGIGVSYLTRAKRAGNESDNNFELTQSDIPHTAWAAYHQKIAPGGCAVCGAQDAEIQGPSPK